MKPESISDVTGGWLRLLVVPLHFAGDVSRKDGLQPLGWAAANDPSVSGGHRASKAGGKAGGTQGKTFVPGHGQIISRKIKSAMRKKILARSYALRILCACPTPTTSPIKTSPTSIAPTGEAWSATTKPPSGGSSITNHNTPGDGSLGDPKTCRGSIPRQT